MPPTDTPRASTDSGGSAARAGALDVPPLINDSPHPAEQAGGWGLTRGKRYLNPLLGRWISADPLAVHAPGEADLNLYAYVSGYVLKAIDPLGLQEAAHNSAQQKLVAAQAQRSGEVAGEQAELVRLQDAYIAAEGDVDRSLALTDLEKHEQKMATTASAWSEQEAQLNEEVKATRVQQFPDGRQGSERTYREEYERKLALELSRQRDNERDQGVGVFARAAHHVIDPPADQAEEGIRRDFYAATGQLIEVLGSVKDARDDAKTGHVASTEDSKTTTRSATTSQAAGTKPGTEQNRPPTPPVRSEAEKGAAFEAGWLEVVKAWFK